eukprot:scaffold6585_cov403-Prasinococcus_capsulatus_cf.AAC.11
MDMCMRVSFNYTRILHLVVYFPVPKDTSRIGLPRSREVQHDKPHDDQNQDHHDERHERGALHELTTARHSGVTLSQGGYPPIRVHDVGALPCWAGSSLCADQ